MQMCHLAESDSEPVYVTGPRQTRTYAARCCAGPPIVLGELPGQAEGNGQRVPGIAYTACTVSAGGVPRSPTTTGQARQLSPVMKSLAWAQDLPDAGRLGSHIRRLDPCSGDASGQVDKNACTDTPVLTLASDLLPVPCSTRSEKRRSNHRKATVKKRRCPLRRAILGDHHSPT